MIFYPAYFGYGFGLVVAGFAAGMVLNFVFSTIRAIKI